MERTKSGKSLVIVSQSNCFFHILSVFNSIKCMKENYSCHVVCRQLMWRKLVNPVSKAEKNMVDDLKKHKENN